jgi:flagellar secretion chaperone FliS
MQSAARTYFQTQVTTTTQGDLLIMLFDAALKFLAQARDKIIERDYAKKGILISNALDILAELQATLNPSKGGKMAENLSKLYIYCSTRLLMANRKLDTDPLDETVRILTGLREAFAEANARVPSKPVAMSTTQNTRVVGTGTEGSRGVASAQAGAASYTMARAAFAVATQVEATPVATPAAAPTAKPAAQTPCDGPALETAFEAGQQPPLVPQALVLQTASQVEGQAHPVTPVRRAMAAYSSRNAG